MSLPESQAADDPAHLFETALALYSEGRPADAASRCRHLLELLPGHPEVQNLLGVAQLALDQTSEALPLLTAAAAADPSRPDFRVNLANAWNRSGDAARAISSYRQALALDPSLAEAWLNLAQTAQLSRRLDQAIVLYRRGLVQTPNDAAAQSGLGSVLYESGLPRAALAAYRRSLALVQNPKVHSGYLYLLEFDARASPERHQIERRRWAALHLPAPRPDRPLVTDPNPERQLTIGIVTPTLDSGTGMLVEPFITDRDRGMFRCLIYSNMAPAGETGPRLAASVDAWRTLGTMPDDQATEIIRGDRVDILVDLANHVGGQRLGVFARRAAPIQVSGWCHGLGTGLATMDFAIADPVALPEAERRFYSETIMDVACRAAFAAPPISPDVAPAPSSLWTFFVRPFRSAGEGRRRDGGALGQAACSRVWQPSRAQERLGYRNRPDPARSCSRRDRPIADSPSWSDKPLRHPCRVSACRRGARHRSGRGSADAVGGAVDGRPDSDARRLDSKRTRIDEHPERRGAYGLHCRKWRGLSRDGNKAGLGSTSARRAPQNAPRPRRRVICRKRCYHGFRNAARLQADVAPANRAIRPRAHDLGACLSSRVWIDVRDRI